MLCTLLEMVGAGPELARNVAISGADPVIPTPFRIGEVAAAVLGALGALVAEIGGSGAVRASRSRSRFRLRCWRCKV